MDKLRKFNVYLPVCYYEVFQVEANSISEAIDMVKSGTGDVEQNCSVANPKWSRKVLVCECNDQWTEVTWVKK